MEAKVIGAMCLLSVLVKVHSQAVPYIAVSSATATTISLSWSVPYSLVDSCVLTWERDTSGECPVENKGNRTLTDMTSEREASSTTGECPEEDRGSVTVSDDPFCYTIEELEEDSNYTIILTAINATGSAVSGPVTGLTRETVPSAAPTSLYTSNVTFSSITVQWGAVDCIHQNGKITGYSLRYWPQRSTCNTRTVYVSGGAVMAFTLTGLAYYTAYSIDVAAINNAGIGKYSDSITAGTKGCDACLQTKGFDHTETLVVGVVGGFIGGVFLTGAMGFIILVVLMQKIRPKRNAVSTSTNPAYGQVEGVKRAEDEMSGMPSGAAMATQEPMYEIVRT